MIKRRDYYERNIYSKRQKKQVVIRKTLRTGQTVDELDELIKIDIEKIRLDNELFQQEKINQPSKQPKPDLTIDSSKSKIEPIELQDTLKFYTKKTGQNIFVIARSRVGKSHLIVKMIQMMKKWDPLLIPVIFAGNIGSNPYVPILDEIVCIDGFRPSIIDSMKLINDLQPNDRKYRWLVVLDDILTARNNETLKNLCLSYRNALISSIISIQSAVLVQRNVRCNASAYFIGKSESQERDSLMDKFLRYQPSFRHIKNKDEQMEKYEQHTDDYKFLAIFPLEPDNKTYVLKAPA